MNIAPFLVGLVPFAFAMSFTPGPNNLMLARAGARFGFARTLPHQTGILIGFAVMTLCVGFGIGALIAAVPPLYLAMRIASIGYMLVLALKIATAKPPGAGHGEGRPMSFLAAAGFQWINPKAWIILLTAVGTYTSPRYPLPAQVALLTAVFAATGVVSSSLWVIFGQLIRRYLTSPSRQRAFNWSMAALLAASLVPAMLER